MMIHTGEPPHIVLVGEKVYCMFTFYLIHQQIVIRFLQLKWFWKAKTVCPENRPWQQLQRDSFILSNASNPESIRPAVAEISAFEYLAEELKILYSFYWMRIG